MRGICQALAVRVALALVAIWGWTGGCGDSPVIYYPADGTGLRYMDILPVADGPVYLLGGTGQLYVVRSYDKPPAPLGERIVGMAGLRLLRSPREGELRVLTEMGGDLGTAGLRDLDLAQGTWRQALSLGKGMREPRAFTQADGTLWISERTGRILRVPGNSYETYRYAEPSPGRRSEFFEYMNLHESVDGAVWGVPSRGCSSVSRRPRAVRFAPTGRSELVFSPRGAPLDNCMDRDGNILVISERGIERLEFADGKLRASLVTAPPNKAVGRPSFMACLPDGTLFTLWAEKRWVVIPGVDGREMATDVAALYDGANWEVLEVPADLGRRICFGGPNGRPQAELPGGRWVVAVSPGGLLLREADGTWVRLGRGEGVPTGRIAQLAVGHDGMLWLRTEMGLCVVLDPAKLSSRWDGWAAGWSEMTLRRPLGRLPSGALLASYAGDPSCIVLSGGGTDCVVALPKTIIEMAKVEVVTLDTDGVPWVFGGDDHDTAAYWETGEWHRFSVPSPYGGPRPAGRLDAFASRAGSQRQDYRVGTFWGAHYVQYQHTKAGNRILYLRRDRHRLGLDKAFFFDGKKWHDAYRGLPRSARSPRKLAPFFHEGRLAVLIDGTCHSVPDAAWAGVPGVNDPLIRHYASPLPAWQTPEWQVSKATVESPYPPRPPVAPRVRVSLTKRPAAYPSALSTFPRDHWDGTRFWLTGPRRLYWSLDAEGEKWDSLPTEGTPLVWGMRILAAEQSDSGVWWFRLAADCEGGYRYVRYAAGRVRAQVGEAADLGVASCVQQVLRPRFVLDGPAEGLRFRHRVGDGEWSPRREVPEFAFLVERKGRYRVTLEISVAGRPALPAVLEYTFRVTKSRAEWIADFVRDLHSPVAEEAEAAEEMLPQFGASALPALRAVVSHPNPDVASRVRRVIARIRLWEGLWGEVVER